MQAGEVAPMSVRHASGGVKCLWCNAGWGQGKSKVKSGRVWELGVGSAHGYSPRCSARGARGAPGWAVGATAQEIVSAYIGCLPWDALNRLSTVCGGHKSY